MGFTQYNFAPELFKGIQEQGFEVPTPVQKHVIPNAMKGRDIRACAQTGTGKTCAFVLPLLDKLIRHPSPHRPNSLIVVPTRELGTQVYNVIKEVGKYTHIRSVLIMGGANMQRQTRQIRSGAEIIVATPGRLLDHLNRRTFTLRKLHTLILDEADRMLDMGFLPDIKRILAMCPEQKHTMFFSATFPPEIVGIVTNLLHDPFAVDLAPSRPAENVTHVLYPISRSQKEKFLESLLAKEDFASALIFCRTKHGADHLANHLRRLGKKVAVIHSNFNQSQRERALQGFREKKYQMLVATDIASRGIDIKDITHVVNYDVPHHPEDYVHRIGRTGRMDAMGDAVTLMAPDEESYVKRIESFIGKPIPRAALEGFPYLVPPKLSGKTKQLTDLYGRIRTRIPVSSHARFRRRS